MKALIVLALIGVVLAGCADPSGYYSHGSASGIVTIYRPARAPAP